MGDDTVYGDADEFALLDREGSIRPGLHGQAADGLEIGRHQPRKSLAVRVPEAAHLEELSLYGLDVLVEGPDLF